MADKNLFKIISSGVAGAASQFRQMSAPALIPVSNEVINVASSFPWTNTAPAARTDVPTIQLKEYRVERSSLYQQARYLLTSTKDVADALGQVGQEAGVLGTLAIGALMGGAAGGAQKRLISAALGAGAAIATQQGLVSNAADAIEKRFNNVFIQPDVNLQPYLQAYAGLYYTSPTGFQYIFPYFSDEWKCSNEQWDSLQGQTYNKFDSTLKDVGSFYHEGGLGGFTGAGALRSFFPGANIEVPKSYSYGDGTNDTKVIKFRLFNTTTYEDVVRNWQLCFLLLYQNRPNRVSRVLVDVPSIYEISIPGVYYCPFAFINQISIEQLGGSRQMSIPVPVSTPGSTQAQNVQTPQGTKQVNVRNVGNTGETVSTNNITTIIPDAYDVEIKITPLVAETRNLIYHTITTNNQSVYDVQVNKPVTPNP